jgi:hypothetical protein
MADDITVRETVRVWGAEYELTVRQKSKSTWLARGVFEGKALEGKGRSPRGAAQNWLEKARWQDEATATDPAAALDPE